MTSHLTPGQIAEFWHRYRAGESPKSIGQRLGVATSTAHERIRNAGGITPTLPCRWQ